jgi:hypothetical protein
MHTGTAQQHARRKKLIAALLAAPAHERCDQGIDQVPTMRRWSDVPSIIRTATDRKTVAITATLRIAVSA